MRAFYLGQWFKYEDFHNMFLLLLLGMEYQRFHWKGPFSKRGEGSRKFWPEAEILGIFSIEVAPNRIVLEFDIYEIRLVFT